MIAVVLFVLLNTLKLTVGVYGYSVRKYGLDSREDCSLFVSDLEIENIILFLLISSSLLSVFFESLFLSSLLTFFYTLFVYLNFILFLLSFRLCILLYFVFSFTAS
jgi:hypothetical protein